MAESTAVVASWQEFLAPLAQEAKWQEAPLVRQRQVYAAYRLDDNVQAGMGLEEWLDGWDTFPSVAEWLCEVAAAECDGDTGEACWLAYEPRLTAWCLEHESEFAVPDAADPGSEAVTGTTDPAADVVAAVNAGQAPTHTMDEYKRCLAQWGKLCDGRAEQNYAASGLALETVEVYLGTHPGKAQRSTAVAELARAACDSDPEYHYPPAGKKAEKWQAECVDYHRREVLKLIHAAATLRLTFGASTACPVVGLDGVCKKAGTKGKAMPWRRIRELQPLVHRTAKDECTERWELLPYVATEDVRGLVRDMVGGLKADDVVKRVRELCLHSAQERLTHGDKAAVDDVAYWGGKLADTDKTVATADKPAAGAAEGEKKPQAKATAADAAEEPAADKADAAGEAPTAGHRESGAKNLLQSATEVAKNATAKDFAGMVWQFAMEHEDPEQVLEELLLVAKGDVSKAMVSGIDALLLVLRKQRERASQPVQPSVPVNGQLATAGAA